MICALQWIAQLAASMQGLAATTTAAAAAVATPISSEEDSDCTISISTQLASMYTRNRRVIVA